MQADPRQQRSGRWLIIGVGNQFRQDDGAGIVLARRLKEAAALSIDIVEADGEGTELIELFEGRDRVIVIDAVSSGAPAGTIHRLDAGEAAVPHGLARSSSHSFGVAEAIEMARSLGRLPQICLVLGIEGESFEYGTGVSMPVIEVVDHTVRELLKQVSISDSSSSHTG